MAQEVWLALIKSIGQIKQPESLHSWLKRVTINAAIVNSTKASRATPWGDIPDAPDSGDGEQVAVDRIAREDTRAKVREAVARLKESDRVLVDLLSTDDRPDYGRISTLIERPIGSIGPTRPRILARLRNDPAVLQLAGRE